MTTYIIIVILLLTTALIAKQFNKRSQLAIYLSWGIILTVFTCLRECSLNIDYNVYKILYLDTPKFELLIENPSLFINSLNVEFSYGTLCAYIRSLNLSLHESLTLIFIIYALIAVPLNLYAIKRLTDLEFLTLFIYVCNLYLLHELTQVRAGVATALILLSIIPLNENNYKKFFAIILIAGFFHTSAFMAIVLLLMKHKNDIKIWGIICSICVIVFLAKIDITEPLTLIPIDYFQYKLKAYIDLQKRENFEINYLNVVFLIQIIVTIICFCYQKALNESNKYFNILMNMNCLSICCFFLFNQIPGFAYRISELFNCSLLFLIPLISKVMKPKVLAEFLVIIIGFGIFCINVFHSNLIEEYKFFWQ